MPGVVGEIGVRKDRGRVKLTGTRYLYLHFAAFEAFWCGRRAPSGGEFVRISCT